MSVSTNLWAVKQLVNISVSVDDFREHGTELPFFITVVQITGAENLRQDGMAVDMCYMPVCVCLCVLGGCV